MVSITTPHVWSIRPAALGEAGVLSAIALKAKRVWGYTEAQIDAWRPQLQIEPALISSSPVYVAEVAGGIAGFYALHVSAQTWSLEHLWVLPEFSRQGIGRALLDHACRIAATGGARLVTIDADPNAENFYLACGATRSGVLAAPLEDIPGRIRPQMELRLPVR